MDSILISIKPEWVAKILNGEKTLEIRKTAPKDWADYLSGKTKVKPTPKTVYIYCTEPHAEEVLSLFVPDVRSYFGGRAVEFIERKRVDNPDMRWSICNGKVVAKFTLREVDEVCIAPFGEEITEYEETLCSKSCLSLGELVKYLRDGMFGYAWHISDLVIFDEPKLLGYHSNFYYANKIERKRKAMKNIEIDETKHPHLLWTNIDKVYDAPQSWCYVEAKNGE